MVLPIHLFHYVMAEQIDTTLRCSEISHFLTGNAGFSIEYIV